MGRDPILAENVVISMRTAALRELQNNVVVEKPTMESILEFDGLRIDPTVESTPHANTQVYNSTYEGARLIPRFMDDDSDDTMARRSLAQEQTGNEKPLRASSPFSAPVNPWPKKNESLTRENAFIMTKRKIIRCTGRDQDKAIAGINMEIRPLRLLPRHQLRKVGKGYTA